MIRIGILGGCQDASKWTHPSAAPTTLKQKLKFVNSSSNAGNLITDVHGGLYGDTDLIYLRDAFRGCRCVFFCFGHGKSGAFLKNKVPADVKIIDMAQDFRLAAEGNDFIYGLPRDQPRQDTQSTACGQPRMFATCIQLGLLPAAIHLLDKDVSVNAITGSTGAGQKPGATTHFSWRNNNMSIYKPFQHQHVPEIKQSLCQFAGWNWMPISTSSPIVETSPRYICHWGYTLRMQTLTRLSMVIKNSIKMPYSLTMWTRP